MKNRTNSNLVINSYINKNYILGKHVHFIDSDRVIFSKVSEFNSKLKSKTSFSGLKIKTKLISGIFAENPQIQLDIEIPDDWNPQRFKELALKEWNKNPWVDSVLTAYISPR